MTSIVGGAAARQALDDRRILTSLGEVAYDWDILSDRLRWGPNAADVLPPATFDLPRTGRDWDGRVSAVATETRRDAVLASAAADAGAGVRYAAVYPIDLATGARLWVDDCGRWFAGADGRPARAHGLLRVLRDTERPAHAEPGRLADLAARLDDLLAPGAEPPEPFALVALARVDADARPLDDAAALRAAAARIAERMRRSDRIALLDDARLLLLLEGCADDEPATAFARFARAAEPVAPHGLRGGVVFGPRPAYDARDLIAEARAALDRACAGGPALVSAPRLRATGRDAEDQRVCDAARTALQEGGLSLALQPVVRAGDRQLAFNECLMRLRGPDGAPLSPMELMPAAERTGLVLQIDHAVLDRSLSLLEADGRRTLSVNVSGPTLHHPMWTRRLDAALAGRERCASRLIIEITETSALENLEATGRALAHLRGLGVRIAMDDFGAGHTSFRNLRALAFDLVKIDGAYVQDLLASPDDQVFVRTLNDLARHLGAATVAEWVQDLEAARLLESWGVGYLQGAAFGLAQDVADAARDAA